MATSYESKRKPFVRTVQCYRCQATGKTKMWPDSTQGFPAVCRMCEGTGRHQGFHVLEVDQWTSTGNIDKIPWRELKRRGIRAISGGDSESARAIFGGTFRWITARPDQGPSMGNAWFVCNNKGYPELYLGCYDSSG